VLAFPLVVVHPHGVAVGSLELGVDVDECLHEVIAWGQILQAGDGRAQVGGIDDRRLPRCQLLHVPPEEWGAGAANLQAGLALVGARHHEVDPPGNRLALHGCRHGDFDPHATVGRLRRAGTRCLSR
jgi:hypothetical protein